MYLCHILHRDTNELIFKIYQAQGCYVNRIDWVKMINADKLNYGIIESDEDISIITKYQFKKFINDKIKTAAINNLQNLIQSQQILQTRNLKEGNILLIEDYPKKMFSFCLPSGRMVNVQQKLKSQHCENLEKMMENLKKEEEYHQIRSKN